MYSANYKTEPTASPGISSISPHQASEFIHCVYIGNDDVSFLNNSFFFGRMHSTKEPASAVTLMDKLLTNDKVVPDVIIFNKPYNQEEMQMFCDYLQTRPQMVSIPLLYNKAHLTEEMIGTIRQDGKVDDLICLSKGYADFVNKVQFLKKIKHHPPTPFFRKDNGVEIKEVEKQRGSMIKRALDILIAGVGLLICSPLFLLVAIAIRIDSKGPVFYTSLRAGKGYRVFRFFKFRTMEVDADKKVDKLGHLNNYDACDQGPMFLKICNDPRVTRIGNFLRKTSIDELPQLFNVLKGDMSLVGNRPLPLYEAATLTTNEAVERFMAPAGITGLWQVNKKKKPNMSVDERIQLDISYARNYSFIYDIKIIAKTPSALLQKQSS